MTSGTLSAEGDARLKKALQAGEQLVWSGQPVPDALAVNPQPGCAMAIMVFFFLGALMSLLAVVGVFGKVDTGGRVAAIIFFFALGGAGFLLIKAPAIGRSWILRETYGLTDKRVILISGGGRVSSLEPSLLTNMKANAKPDGSGDLIFATVATANRTTNVGFFGLRNVAETEALVRKTLLPPA